MESHLTFDVTLVAGQMFHKTVGEKKAKIILTKVPITVMLYRRLKLYLCKKIIIMIRL